MEYLYDKHGFVPAIEQPNRLFRPYSPISDTGDYQILERIKASLVVRDVFPTAATN